MSQARTVLLVDDDEDAIMLAERAFELVKTPCGLATASSGDEAIRYLNGIAHGVAGAMALPAVMVLDLKMPGRSGFEVLEWIRSQPSLASMPVVVMTSSDSDSDVARAMTLGANSYLVKPIHLPQLEDMISLLVTYWVKLNLQPELLRTA